MTTLSDLNRALENPAEFKRLVKHTFELEALAEQFPDHAEALIQKILQDPEEFKRLVKHNFELIALAKQFPGHANILGCATVEAAIKVATSEEIKRTARLLTQGSRSSDSLLKRLPDEILLKIVDLSTNSSKALTPEEAEKIAREHLGRP